jgi:hypothetical protein
MQPGHPDFMIGRRMPYCLANSFSDLEASTERSYALFCSQHFVANENQAIDLNLQDPSHQHTCALLMLAKLKGAWVGGLHQFADRDMMPLPKYA